MRLIDTLKMSVSAALMQKLQYIDTHDFSSVKTKVRKDLEEQGQTVADAYIDSGILALKQYYALTIIDGRNVHAVSDTIDPFWHAHILHTEQYVAFCNNVAGCYLHHDPLDHADTEKVERMVVQYNITRRRYDECFTCVDARFHPFNPSSNRIVCGGNGQDISFSLIAAMQSRVLDRPRILLQA